MPSPFPGMDPFLEHPAIFPDLHDSMTTYLREALQASLPEPYYATLGNRVWVETSRRLIGPDVKVHHPGQNGGPGGEGGIAVAQGIAVEPIVVLVPHDERRETFVEIYARGESDRLITSIEILSPTNKTPGEQGRDLYAKKQREVLDSKDHLVEIDLLRSGTHSTAVPLDFALAKAGPFDYHVCIHQFHRWEEFLVYPIRLEQPLPQIGIPLLPDHDPVRLDLQAVMTRCYDAGPYRCRIRYANLELIPSLDEARFQWVAQVLRDKGILPPAS